MNKPFNSTTGYPSVRPTISWDSSSANLSLLAAVWIGTAGNLKISVVSGFGTNGVDVLTFVTLKNMGPNNMSMVDYMRNINPNQEQASDCCVSGSRNISV